MNRYLRFLSLLLLFPLLLSPSLTAHAEAAIPDSVDPAIPDELPFEEQSWEDLVDDLIAELRLSGTFALGYCNTVTGEEHYYRPDALFLGASLYKTPLNMYYSEQIRLGNLREDYQVMGLPYETAQSYSLTYSDNPTSEEMLTALGGWTKFRARIAEFLGEDPNDAEYLSRGNAYSAREMTHCMTLLQQQSERFPGVIDCLLKSAPGKFLKFADVPYDIAQKYGNILYEGSNLFHVSGIVYTEEPIALVVLTNNVGNQRAIMEQYCLLMCRYAEAHVQRAETAPAAEETPSPAPAPVVSLPASTERTARTQTIAVILPGAVVYHSGLILALSILAGLFLFLALRAAQHKPLIPSLMFYLISLVLSIPLARLLHWYCNSAQYPSLAAAMTDYSSGGYSPLGAAAAVLLALGLLRVRKAFDDLPALLDALAPAAALTIGVGRLACLFSVDDRSKFTLADPRFRRLPFMVSSTLTSGATEWRIATFAWQSIACALICAVLLALFHALRSRPRHRNAWQDGNVFLHFLALYGAVNIVLDSTRYDALYLRSNGFISLTQICCMAGLLFATVLYSVRSVKANRLRPRHFVAWLLWAAGAGTAGYMEYYVQRHAARFLFSYAVMGSCLLLLFAIVCVLCRSTRKREDSLTADSRPPEEAPNDGTLSDEGT